MRIFANILSALHRSGLPDVPVLTGDVALFHAALDALPMSDRIRTRLRGLFWRPEQLRTQISRMQAPIALPAGMAEGDLAAQLLENHVVQGKRTPAEVADLLNDRATDILPADSAQILLAYLNISAPIGDVPDAVRALLGDRLDDALIRFEDRLRELRHRLGPETAAIRSVRISGVATNITMVSCSR